MEEFTTQIKNEGLLKKRHLDIVREATKLFIEKGYFQTGMREISKATNIKIGNLYDYISKKEDILYLVLDHFASTWESTLEEEKLSSIDDPVEQLRTAVRKMLQAVKKNRASVLLAYRESRSLPHEFLRKILTRENNLIHTFEKILIRGNEKGVFDVKETFFTAHVIVYLLSIEPLRGWSLKERYSEKKLNKSIEDSVLEIVVPHETK